MAIKKPKSSTTHNNDILVQLRSIKNMTQQFNVYLDEGQ